MAVLAAALRRRRDDILLAATRRVEPRLPRGVALHPTAEAELRATVGGAVDTAIALIAGDRRVSDEEVAMLRATAARRARQGMLVETMRAVVLVALTTTWDSIVEAVLEVPPGTATTAAMGRAGSLLGHFSEMATAALAAVYSGDAPPVREDVSPRAQALADILSGGSAADAAVAELRHQGVSPAALHGLLLVAATAPHQDRLRVRDAVAALRSRLAVAVEVPLTSTGTGHVTLAVPEVASRWAHCLAVSDDVARGAGVLVYTAAPLPAPELAGSYARAARLLQVAQRARMLPRALQARDLRLASVLDHAAADRRAFVEESMGPILALSEHQREPLLQTLQALSQVPLRGGVRAAAAALNVHLKTVYYRLNRIRQLTGLDLDVPAERMQLALALEWLRFGDEAPAADVELRGFARAQG